MMQVLFSTEDIQQINEKLDRIDKKIDSVLEIKPDTLIWLTTKQAAQALQITTRTLQTYRDQGMIPFSQFGREIRYQQSDIQQFLIEHYIKGRRIAS